MPQTDTTKPDELMSTESTVLAIGNKFLAALDNYEKDPKPQNNVCKGFLNELEEKITSLKQCIQPSPAGALPA